MTIELTQDENGVWTYHDPFQQELVITVHALIGWEMAAFDAWLNEPSGFTGFPLIRKNMIFLRERFTQDCRQHWKQNEMIEALASDLLHTSHVARLLMEKRRYEKVQALRRTDKGKLSEAQKKELVLEFNTAPAKYGQIKRLAVKNGVSTSTIHRALKKP